MTWRQVTITMEWDPEVGDDVIFEVEDRLRVIEHQLVAEYLPRGLVHVAVLGRPLDDS